MSNAKHVSSCEFEGCLFKSLTRLYFLYLGVEGQSHFILVVIVIVSNAWNGIFNEYEVPELNKFQRNGVSVYFYEIYEIKSYTSIF